MALLSILDSLIKQRKIKTRKSYNKYITIYFSNVSKTLLYKNLSYLAELVDFSRKMLPKLTPGERKID